MSTTRTARFVQNTLSTALYQLTAMVMGFITPRLMILYYGSEINGLIVSVTEFLTYFKMLEAGLAASVNVALYEPLARRDRQRHRISSTPVLQYGRLDVYGINGGVHHRLSLLCAGSGFKRLAR